MPPSVPTLAAQASTRTATGASAAVHQGVTFPILDKHTKPLVGSDTAKAVRGIWSVLVDPFPVLCADLHECY